MHLFLVTIQCYMCRLTHGKVILKLVDFFQYLPEKCYIRWQPIHHGNVILKFKSERDAFMFYKHEFLSEMTPIRSLNKEKLK